MLKNVGVSTRSVWANAHDVGAKFASLLKYRQSLKKALVLYFAFLLSINSFAAVVADNDGSAFITKAEFDSLKNNFQSQLDSYNTTIDSKIDSAIASSLAGINFSREFSLLLFIDSNKFLIDLSPYPSNLIKSFS